MSELYTHNCALCGEPFTSREIFPAHPVCPQCNPAPLNRLAPGKGREKKKKKDRKKARQAKKSRKKNRKK
jgi:endogenous inhibitor of DNA gyrase (YacG/DUF329 family)